MNDLKFLSTTSNPTDTLREIDCFTDIDLILNVVYNNTAREISDTSDRVVEFMLGGHCDHHRSR